MAGVWCILVVSHTKIVVTAGPVLLQNFCAAKEISNGNCNRNPQPAEETAKETTASDTRLKLHGKDGHRPLMEGLASCLRYTGNSLPVRRDVVRFYGLVNLMSISSGKSLQGIGLTWPCSHHFSSLQ